MSWRQSLREFFGAKAIKTAANTSGANLAELALAELKKSMPEMWRDILANDEIGDAHRIISSIYAERLLAIMDEGKSDLHSRNEKMLLSQLASLKSIKSRDEAEKVIAVMATVARVAAKILAGAL